MSDQPSLGRRTAVGMMWAYGSYVGGRLLVLVSTAILARILTPEDFGVVATALVFTMLLDTFSDLGLSEALIVERDDRIDQRASMAFALSIGMGAVLWGITAAASPLIADFFDQSELTALLPVLGANFLLRALGTTHYALAQKRLDFRARTTAELSDVITRGLAGIGLAVAGAGVWSLVLGYVLGSLAFVIALWVTVRWRPRRPTFEGLRSLVAFGGALTVLDLLSVITANVDYVVIGHQLGATQLGLYSLGLRLPELLLLNLSAVASRVLYPAFATVDRDALSGPYRTALGLTLIFALPVAAGLIVLSEPTILALFGPQWGPSVEVMRWLALAFMFLAIEIPAGTVYKAMRRPDILLWLGVPRAIATVVVVLLVADAGIDAVAQAGAAIMALWAVMGTALATRMLHTPWRMIFAAAGPPVVATAAMVVPMHLVAEAVPGVWPSLILGALTGAVVFFAVLSVVGRTAVRQLAALILPRLRPDPPAA